MSGEASDTRVNSIAGDEASCAEANFCADATGGCHVLCGLILDDGQIDLQCRYFDDARLSVCGGSQCANNGTWSFIVSGSELDGRLKLGQLCWQLRRHWRWECQRHVRWRFDLFWLQADSSHWCGSIPVLSYCRFEVASGGEEGVQRDGAEQVGAKLRSSDFGTMNFRRDHDITPRIEYGFAFRMSDFASSRGLSEGAGG